MGTDAVGDEPMIRGGAVNVSQWQTRHHRSSSRRDGRTILCVSAALVASTLLFVSCVHQPITVSYTLEGETEFGIAFVGLADDASRAVAAQHLPVLGVGITRMEADWGYREPEEGIYNWAPMDARMDLLQDLGVRAVVTFPADAPEWLRDRIDPDRVNPRSAALNEAARTAFADYVEAVLHRYLARNPGVVEWVQFGNEWGSRYNYVGSGEDFRLSQNVFYNAVKGVDPGLTVVLGGLSVGRVAGLAAYDGTVDALWDSDGTVLTAEDIQSQLADEQQQFDAGEIAETSLSRLETVLEGSSYDWVDVHLYDQWEDFAAYVEALRSRLPASFSGRIVVTEFGGPHPVAERHLSNTEHARMVERYIAAIDPLDVAFALHFRLVRSRTAVHHRSGLMRRGLGDPVPLPAYEVFGRMNNPTPRPRSICLEEQGGIMSPQTRHRTKLTYEDYVHFPLPTARPARPRGGDPLARHRRARSLPQAQALRTAGRARVLARRPRCAYGLVLPCRCRRLRAHRNLRERHHLHRPGRGVQERGRHRPRRPAKDLVAPQAASVKSVRHI